ncbi:periplasmic heavy metal sensor [Trichlorobacter lovleyi]|uniref:periplasmic heavy metal sensor n=1 Tax=Trichlorobacter lovleyi TaxID=313985 RepID=UPI002480A252|nr:periplasmic heavy metal sensor [Trichlorobacter lovleyi]
MKKSLLALTVVAAVAVAGASMAMPGMGPGAGMGAGMGAQMGQAGTMTPEMKKFIADTMPIREEMHAKHMQLQKELIKDAPDQAVIKKLQGEMVELRKKMMDARTKAGLPMGKMGKRGHKGMRGGGMGMGMMQMDCPMVAPPATAK